MTVVIESLESRTLLAAGTLDPTFGVGSEVRHAVDVETDERANAAALQADGKLLVCGAITREGQSRGEGVFAVRRFNPDGSIDRTFGAAGEARPARRGSVPGRRGRSRSSRTGGS